MTRRVCVNGLMVRCSNVYPACSSAPVSANKAKDSLDSQKAGHREAVQPSGSKVIGERVRDKISASKRKGIWFVGPVALGYRSVDKKPQVVPADAETVRVIF